MKNKIDHAFILAAGKGTRLRPYTDTMPKPMVAVNGVPILEHTLEKLKKSGVKKTTINLYYLGDRIKNHFSNYNDISLTFSHETELLDTGGGVLKALPTMNNKPFYLINGDALWEDDTSSVSSFDRLDQHWDEGEMDILLLLQPVDSMVLTGGVGDYDIDDKGCAIRNKNKLGKYMFTGVRITHPRIFKSVQKTEFSFLELMDKAEAKGTLHGLVHTGLWHHISTPEDLENVNNAYKANKQGEK